MFSTAIVEIHREAENLEVRVKNARLDASVSERFKAACAAAWMPAIKTLTIDLEEVEFIDSTGIGALLSLYRKLPKEQVNLVRLRRVRRTVRSVIELLRLQPIFRIEGVETSFLSPEKTRN